jgi:hypothetical protein
MRLRPTAVVPRLATRERLKRSPHFGRGDDCVAKLRVAAPSLSSVRPSMPESFVSHRGRARFYLPHWRRSGVKRYAVPAEECAQF